MANLNSNESNIFQSCDKKLDLAFWVLDGAAGLVILAGNLVACVVIISSPRLRQNIMNIFLLSLAASDLLIAFLLVPGYAAFCEGCEYPQTKYCHVFSAIKDIPVAAVIFNLLATSYDRYVAVFNPLHYRSCMSSSRVGIILSFVWVIPIFLFIIRYLVHHFLNASRVHDAITTYNTVLVVAFVFLPILILVVLNTMLTRAIKRQKSRIHATRSDIVSENTSTITKKRERSVKNAKRRKGTVSCIIVVLIFVICWFPRAFYSVWTMANKNKPARPVFLKITMLSLIVQSAINPFIYSMYRREFRRAAEDLASSFQFWYTKG